MGSDDGDFDEQPLHQVTITQPFYMAVTEVTNSQYEVFDPEHRGLRGKLGFSSLDDEAVVFVSWHDANAFCKWLSKQEGLPYRLPTEAEWEYVCRAGTTTKYSCGDSLPLIFQKNPVLSWFPDSRSKLINISLLEGQTPANPWGLFDMHGNVEEWCWDWYGPYNSGRQVDPVGYSQGDFKVSRGGSHSTPLEYLRSSNRMGTLPEDKSWLIGFRVVIGELADSQPRRPDQKPLWSQNVSQERFDWSDTPKMDQAFFEGPRTYIKIPDNSDGPLYSRHNHCPALTACPNGDLLAIWYSTRIEPGREMSIAASRLRRGATEWQPASLFWDAPDRNDSGSALWWDGGQTLYHFNGLSAAGTWGNLAIVMRTSTDNGATWSKAKLIVPEHGTRTQVIAGVLRTRDGKMIFAADAVTGGHGGTAIHKSQDNGKTWRDPGLGKPVPDFKAHNGAWIAGIHAGVVELRDSRLMALGRGNAIDGQMPKSISDDGGETWSYSASGFPPISGGQRLALIRLREGPLFLASFADSMNLVDAAGEQRTVRGLFGALSWDDGKTWPTHRLIVKDNIVRRFDGGGNTDWFTMSPFTAEHHGYLDCVQTPDRIIHLISSKQHYAFNLKWLQTPMPAIQRRWLPPKLPVKATLVNFFNAATLLQQVDSGWRFSSSDQKRTVFAIDSSMRIACSEGRQAFWINDAPKGFAQLGPNHGFTVQARIQILKCIDKTRGIDLEACVGEGRMPYVRAFISISENRLSWFFGNKFEVIAEGLDNTDKVHTFRLAITSNYHVLIYRDGELLACRLADATATREPRSSRPHLICGKQQQGGDVEALVEHIAFDLSGAFGQIPD